jgi:hypothetical protein
LQANRAAGCRQRGLVVKYWGETVTKVRHYYGLRNKLIHERATVEQVLTILFRLKFTD